MTRTYLTALQEQLLLESASDGDTNARNSILMNVYHLIKFTVNKHFFDREVDRDDAVQYVMTVLCEKFYKFDPARKHRYMTYANFWVRQAMQQYRLKRKLIPFRDKSTKIISMEPASHEEQHYFQEFICAPEFSPASQMEEGEELVELDRVLNLLSPKHRDIVIRRSKGEKLQAIADSMGLSKERIRQIEKAAVEQLKTYFQY